MRTHYDNLKIKRNASMEEVKAAYRSLAQKWHPDKNKDKKQSERNFKIINNAYYVLRDENRRREYDAFLLLNTIDEPIKTPSASHKGSEPYPTGYQEKQSASTKQESKVSSYKKQNRWAVMLSSFALLASLFLSVKTTGGIETVALIASIFILGTGAILLLDRNATPTLLFNSRIVSFFITPWLVFGVFVLIVLPFYIPSLFSLSMFNEMPLLLVFMFYLPTIMVLIGFYAYSIFLASEKTGLLPENSPFKSIQRLPIAPRQSAVITLSVLGVALYYLAPFVINPIEQHFERPSNLLAYFMVVVAIASVGRFMVMALLSEQKEHDITVSDLSSMTDSFIENKISAIFGLNNNSIYTSTIVSLYVIATIVYLVGYNPYA